MHDASKGSLLFIVRHPFEQKRHHMLNVRSDYSRRTTTWTTAFRLSVAIREIMPKSSPNEG
ncbi:hypothetical protein CR51_29620 [Caballeronia megalochromosomata]|nr:hypothetical protein CR51_29620 [Caballeronia megalochromosomata]